MILVTGATGFVGRRLVTRLTRDLGFDVRVLLRPGTDLSRLPRGVRVDAAVADLNNHDALVEAMDRVHTIFHLIGTDTRGRYAQLDDVDVAGTKLVMDAARAARVGRVVYLSRIGADRGSAYSILRAKGHAEEAIRQSGLAYTIFRSSVLFGESDRFSQNLAMLISSSPVFFVPGDGDMTMQPLWVEDLITCLTMSLENLDHLDKVISLGGPEVLSYRRMAMRVMYTIGHQRPIVGLPMLMHRVGGWYLDGLFARWPVTEIWAELLSSNQTAEIGLIEREFGFRPRTFDVGVLSVYLRKQRHMGNMLRYITSVKWDS